MRITAMPTPTYEKFSTVTISVGLESGVLMTKISPSDARELAEDILYACEIVEGDE